MARWMTSLRSSPRPASPVPNSLRRIAKRCAVGQPQDVVEQVEVDRRAGVLDRQQALALAVAVVDLRQLAGPSVVPGSHSTNFSPIRPWGRILQLASVFHGVKSVVVDPQRDRGLLVGGHVEVGDDARPGRRRPSRPRPCDERGGVVEDRAHEVVVRRVVVAWPRARCRSRSRARSPRTGRCRSSRLMGPGGVVGGFAASARPGREPSGDGWVAPPGQSGAVPRSKPSSRCCGGIAASVPARGRAASG